MNRASKRLASAIISRNRDGIRLLRFADGSRRCAILSSTTLAGPTFQALLPGALPFSATYDFGRMLGSVTLTLPKHLGGLSFTRPYADISGTLTLAFETTKQPGKLGVRLQELQVNAPLPIPIPGLRRTTFFLRQDGDTTGVLDLESGLITPLEVTLRVHEPRTFRAVRLRLTLWERLDLKTGALVGSGKGVVTAGLLAGLALAFFHEKPPPVVEPPPTEELPPPEEPPECCCCVDSATIQNIAPYNNGVHFGHEFDFVIDMTYTAGTGGVCSCTLEWNERTDLPYAPGMAANTWTDMFALVPTSPTFDPWNNRGEPCPQGGALQVTIHDPPALAIRPGRTATRKLEFNLVVQSCPDCGCTHDSRSDTATQNLSIINGVPTVQDFDHP